MRRLVAAGLLPERAGQPVKIWAHVSLAELRARDDGSVLQREWIGGMAIRWAARRAPASAPVVTGQIDPAALDDLLNLCLQFTGHGPHCGPSPDPAAQPAQTSD